MKLIRPNYYKLMHNKVTSEFEGDLKYIGTFETIKIINSMDIANPPTAVYRSAKPNRDKGHKDYLLLFKRPHINESFVTVGGLDKDIMENHAIQTGIWCNTCDDVIYSVHRHDFTRCGCKETWIDGGRDYIRVGCNGVLVSINHLTGDIDMNVSAEGNLDA